MNDNELDPAMMHPQDFEDGGEYFEALLAQHDAADEDFDADAAEADYQQWLAERDGRDDA